MILVGMVLIVLGAAVGVVAYLAATSQSQTVELTAFGWSRAFTVLELVAVGAAALLLVWLGWSAISVTLRRRSRLRREERERDRYAELEATHSDYVADTDRRFEEARLREEDLARHEEQLRTRQAEIELREEEIARRETARREEARPTVADVVTGRAEGSVSEGTAQWTGDDAATQPQDAAHPDDVPTAHAVDESRADETPVDEGRVDERPANQTSAHEDLRRTDRA